MKSPAKLIFLGNSQLLTGVVAASGCADQGEQCGAAWRDSRVSKGAFESPNTTEIELVACNMSILGDPFIVDGVLSYSQAFEHFMALVDLRCAPSRPLTYSAAQSIRSPNWKSRPEPGSKLIPEITSKA
jgi:hypothetical protein